jgi:hypothetical protein
METSEGGKANNACEAFTICSRGEISKKYDNSLNFSRGGPVKSRPSSKAAEVQESSTIEPIRKSSKCAIFRGF